MSKRILLVEDDRHIALALKIRLQAEGYDVGVVHGSEDAWSCASERPPDVALIDYNLPDGTGFDLIQRFSENTDTCLVRSIVMTASKQSGLRDKALAVGAIEYFEKPFKSTDLIAFIRSLPEVQ
jgi:DNA-binding response OmpR family regulator